MKTWTCTAKRCLYDQARTCRSKATDGANEHFQLNEIDKPFKVIDNPSTSTADATRHHTEFEVHAMVDKTLPTPNAMQALRERLIALGSIVPDRSNEIAENCNNSTPYQLLTRFLSHIEKLEELSNSFYKKVFRLTFEASTENTPNGKNCKFLRLLRTSLLLNVIGIYFEINNLISNKRISLNIHARCGFYSPFKENMKNLP